jgi:hypothetical protein
MTPGTEEPRRAAEIVVGVRGSADPGEVLRTAQRIGKQLGAMYASRPAVVLLLSEDEHRKLPPQPSAEGVQVVSWSHPGQGPLEATLRAAEAFEARAIALVAPAGEDSPTDAARHLLAPVLEGSCDFVLPCYATHRFEGVMSTGVVSPVVRALFGRRLRQPMVEELALSRPLATYLLGEAWHADAHAGEPLWLVAAALAGGYEVCQSHLGPRPRPTAEAGVDLAASLAQVMGALFHEMRLLAHAWQRIKGSRPVQARGEPIWRAGEAGQPQIAPLRSAFQLGYQELGSLWGAVLPPQTLLALKRLSQTPEESFGIDDALWARIVYDFGVAYHLAAMDRSLLLRSMTPLYLGWVAGYVREVRDLDPAAVEARLERLARAFEAMKPYLIQRWRWPDRFNP